MQSFPLHFSILRALTEVVAQDKGEQKMDVVSWVQLHNSHSFLPLAF